MVHHHYYREKISNTVSEILIEFFKQCEVTCQFEYLVEVVRRIVRTGNADRRIHFASGIR